jgi:hypothetical protein
MIPVSKIPRCYCKQDVDDGLPQSRKFEPSKGRGIMFRQTDIAVTWVESESSRSLTDVEVMVRIGLGEAPPELLHGPCMRLMHLALA